MTHREAFSATPAHTAPRIIGGPPAPACTGSYGSSTGRESELQAGFDADDLQGLHAPSLIPSGGMTTYGWSSRIDGEALAIFNNTTGRPE